jgi:ribulose-phosphate 3-epimerase
MEIYPSLISGDILNLETVIKNLEPIADGLHIDVMDNHFVPNLTWGPGFVNEFSKKTSLASHVHLMVDNPASWIKRIELREKDAFIFHIEAVKNIEEAKKIIEEVKQKNWQVGIALNPKTSLEKIYDIIHLLDVVLLMSVEPGFSGQSFISSVVEKVSPLVALRKEKQLSFSISMDGGIGKDTIAMLKEKGVDNVGVASAIFSNKNYQDELKKLKALAL